MKQNKIKLNTVTPLIKKIAINYHKIFSFLDIKEIEQELYTITLEVFNQNKFRKSSLERILKRKLFSKLLMEYKERKHQSIYILKDERPNFLDIYF